MNSSNVDHVVKQIKNIADKLRCVRCDELRGPRVRYACGHSLCDNCVVTAEDCLLCLSPPNVPKTVIDGPLSLRVKHTSHLLNCFQELFKIDVYRRQRLSEHLQLEKQLFPKCIQALSKYSNSRKSLNLSIENKENVNHTLFPGENISTPNISKMENKMSYVQQWLNKNETSLRQSNLNLPRKPFTDINVNSPNIIRQIKVAKNKRTRSKRKGHVNSSVSISKAKSKLTLTGKRRDVEMKIGNGLKKSDAIECDNNESGIVIDDEDFIINDTESIDKDKEALLAVIEANKEESSDDVIISLSKREIDQNVSTNVGCKANKYQAIETPSMIPFYRKSSLLKLSHNQFNDSGNEVNKTTITVNSHSFVTTIKVYEEEHNVTNGIKCSVEVQTDNETKSKVNSLAKAMDLQVPNEIDHLNETIHTAAKDGSEKNDHDRSADLFEEVISTKGNQQDPMPVMASKCLIIDASDSDSDILPSEKDCLLEVTADVHRSATEIVLSQLEQGEYEQRKRHAVRGRTPASTDSSEKENYDPNKVKRQKLLKKYCKKF